MQSVREKSDMAGSRGAKEYTRGERTVEHDGVHPSKLLEEGDEEGGHGLFIVAPAVQRGDRGPEGLLARLFGIPLNVHELRLGVMALRAHRHQHLQRGRGNNVRDQESYMPNRAEVWQGRRVRRCCRRFKAHMRMTEPVRNQVNTGHRTTPDLEARSAHGSPSSCSTALPGHMNRAQSTRQVADLETLTASALTRLSGSCSSTELGVSGQRATPMVKTSAGTRAMPSDQRQPSAWASRPARCSTAQISKLVNMTNT